MATTATETKKLDCQKLRKAMTAKKVSIADLAKNGLYYTQVAQIIAGKNIPARRRRMRWRRTLGSPSLPSPRR